MTQAVSCFDAHLVAGGARSGKTGHALQLARASGLEKWMVATALAEDDEMRARIEKHRAEREEDWRLIEAPLDLCAALARALKPQRILVVDCLTLWLSNLMFHQRDLAAEIAALAQICAAPAGPLLLVTNELGMGLAPDTRLGRDFRDWHGLMNQSVAAQCAHMSFVVAGQALRFK